LFFVRTAKGLETDEAKERAAKKNRKRKFVEVAENATDSDDEDPFADGDGDGDGDD